jgi:hypothetical protein
MYDEVVSTVCDKLDHKITAFDRDVSVGFDSDDASSSDDASDPPSGAVTRAASCLELAEYPMISSESENEVAKQKSLPCKTVTKQRRRRIRRDCLLPEWGYGEISVMSTTPEVLGRLLEHEDNVTPMTANKSRTQQQVGRPVRRSIVV